jgi:23S rRNA pseudouridine955/2504/2580 synthase/23S rRNA pseudouridine1911/1915/1917 synthase
MSVEIFIPDHILFEDPYILVINKPCSLMVEPDRNGHPNLQQQVKQYLKVFLSPGEELYAQHIHRLDRPVSGIILFAKQKMVLKNLSEQFAERKVKKYYQALTNKVPYSEKAILKYEVKPVSADRFLWDIELHTGKYHQIRAQLSHAACPVIGDHLYGSVTPYKPDSIALHASKLIFSHPVSNEEMVIETAAAF